MTSQLGKQTIAVHILPNISRSKSNQTIKFDQLIESNMINFFKKTLKRGLELASLPHLIVLLLLLHEILENMCIVFVFQPGCNVINLEINFVFQIMELVTFIEANKKRSFYL